MFAILISYEDLSVLLQLLPHLFEKLKIRAQVHALHLFPALPPRLSAAQILLNDSGSCVFSTSAHLVDNSDPLATLPIPLNHPNGCQLRSYKCPTLETHFSSSPPPLDYGGGVFQLDSFEEMSDEEFDISQRVLMHVSNWIN